MPTPKYPVDTPLSLAHLSELDVPPAELITIAARAGFSSVGFRTAPASPGGIVYALATAAEQAEVKRRTADTGVCVLYIELISLDEKLRAEDHRPMLEIGAAIGATRLAVAGDIKDFAIVAEKLADVADLARPYGIAVDLEFMPYRGVASLADALDVVRRANRPNAHVLVDALHIYRSNSALEALRAADPKLIGTFQICDAPLAPPAFDGLVVEARTRRLLPGEGGLPLWPLIDALPPGVPLGVEVPLAGQHPNASPAERLAILVKGTREFLARGRTA